MCDPFKAITRAIDPVVKVAQRAITIPGLGGDNGAEAAATSALANAQNSANAALAAQTQATQQAQAAADTRSEAATLSSEDRIKKLLAASSFANNFRAPSSGASIGYRTLFGT